LEKPNEKAKEEITVKKVKGQVADEEKNEIKKLVVKNKNSFLQE
jgi:hypothetical protein